MLICVFDGAKHDRILYWFLIMFILWLPTLKNVQVIGLEIQFE